METVTYKISSISLSHKFLDEIRGIEIGREYISDSYTTAKDLKKISEYAKKHNILVEVKTIDEYGVRGYVVFNGEDSHWVNFSRSLSWKYT